MLSKLAFVANDSLVSERTTKSDDEREEDPDLAEAFDVGQLAQASRRLLLRRRRSGWRRCSVPTRAAAGSANAAARIADSVICSPSSSATSRPRRMTSTRCARPSISSSSDEMSDDRPCPPGPGRRAGRRSRASRRRRRRGSARPRCSTRGSPRSMRAKSTFCWLPPDSVRTGARVARRADVAAVEDARCARRRSTAGRPPRVG